MTDMKKEDNK